MHTIYPRTAETAPLTTTSNIKFVEVAKPKRKNLTAYQVLAIERLLPLYSRGLVAAIVGCTTATIDQFMYRRNGRSYAASTQHSNQVIADQFGELLIKKVMNEC